MFTVPGSQSKVEILFIDTVVLAGLCFLNGTECAFPLTEPNMIDAEKEWKWIESSLNLSTADWILVCGHYPGALGHT